MPRDIALGATSINLRHAGRRRSPVLRCTPEFCLIRAAVQIRRREGEVGRKRGGGRMSGGGIPAVPDNPA